MEKVVGNCPLWYSAMGALDLVAVLHRGSCSIVLTDCHSDTACNELLGFHSFLNSTSIVQLPLIHYQQVQRLKCSWLCFSADFNYFFFGLLELIMCLLPSCCLGLSHSTFSIPSPGGNSYAGSPFRCLVHNSQAPGEATQNLSIRYLSDCILDTMDHIRTSYHWVVLSTANFRLQIFLRSKWAFLCLVQL